MGECSQVVWQMGGQQGWGARQWAEGTRGFSSGEEPSPNCQATRPQTQLCPSERRHGEVLTALCERGCESCACLVQPTGSVPAWPECFLPLAPAWQPGAPHVQSAGWRGLHRQTHLCVGSCVF